MVIFICLIINTGDTIFKNKHRNVMHESSFVIIMLH